MGRWRLVLGILGVLVVLYGVVNLGLHIPMQTLAWVAVWLVAAVIIHQGLVSPIVIGVSSLLRRLIPDRGRRYLQAALIMAVPVMVIAIPMIYRQGSQPPSKALLLQNFTANLGLLLGIIAALCLVGYAMRVARDRSPARGGPPST
ncbi:MAG TPA: hypothetical protein VKA58_08090 [Propionibacteriaceae bacterium]|nr:hypothetical protein [Propionibacteriaceae bacterium]